MDHNQSSIERRLKVPHELVASTDPVDGAYVQVVVAGAQASCRIRFGLANTGTGSKLGNRSLVEAMEAPGELVHDVLARASIVANVMSGFRIEALGLTLDHILPPCETIFFMAGAA